MDTPPARLLAWLGPAISQPAFEVGDEVRAAFVAAHAGAEACFLPNERGRWQADLYALAGRMLGAAGVDAVYGGGLCTFGDAERFFSYRRDGQCGRMASFVARRR
jgi:copper oxidase (laccase) domain-containing protein